MNTKRLVEAIKVIAEETKADVRDFGLCNCCGKFIFSPEGHCPSCGAPATMVIDFGEIIEFDIEIT